MHCAAAQQHSSHIDTPQQQQLIICIWQPQGGSSFTIV
jgi:hypothetical protein